MWRPAARTFAALPFTTTVPVLRSMMGRLSSPRMRAKVTLRLAQKSSATLRLMLPPASGVARTPPLVPAPPAWMIWVLSVCTVFME